MWLCWLHFCFEQFICAKSENLTVWGLQLYVNCLNCWISAKIENIVLQDVAFYMDNNPSLLIK